MNTFSELGLSESMLNSVAAVGFKVPTAVQSKTIGLVLSGVDVIATAQTGTGKTGAYAIPLIQKMSELQERRFVSALVLVPTRELALQVKAQFDALGKKARVRCVAIYGGTGYGGQFASLARGADVVVATPGRLNDLLMQRAVNLTRVKTAVLDEADRLLDMGFLPQVKTILSQLPDVHQTLMFTATLDEGVREISTRYMDNAQLVQCKADTTVPTLITQRIHNVQEGNKKQLLLDVLEECGDGTVLVFTKTRRKAAQVAKDLQEADVRAEEIHGEITQSKRERTLRAYREGKFKVLVATDIAARGLDVPAITHVVNYDLPQSPEDYVHRIGRTGRAGKDGTAHTFLSKAERNMMVRIERLLHGKEQSREEVQKTVSFRESHSRSNSPAHSMSHKKVRNASQGGTHGKSHSDPSEWKQSKSQNGTQGKSRNWSPEWPKNKPQNGTQGKSRNWSPEWPKSKSQNESRYESRSDSRFESRSDSRNDSRNDSRSDSRYDSRSESQSGSQSRSQAIRSQNEWSHKEWSQDRPQTGSKEFGYSSKRKPQSSASQGPKGPKAAKGQWHKPASNEKQKESQHSPFGARRRSFKAAHKRKVSHG